MRAFAVRWKKFLHRLERAWFKSESHYSRSPKWHSWAGQFITQRRQDPLLSYLKNARDADEHTVAEITARVAGVAIGAPPGQSVVVDSLVIKNGQVFVDSTGPLVVEFLPARTQLLPVANRGRTYPVPTVHLGKPVNRHDVLEMAFLSLDWYRDFADRTETHFVTLA